MRKMSLTAKIVLIVSAVFVIAGTVLGVIFVGHTRSNLRKMSHEHMLDISNTAAASLNGDDLAALTAGSEDSEAYRAAFSTLSVFRDNASLKNIYCIRDTGAGFIYIVDTNKEEPAAFGASISANPSLQRAAEGTSSANEKATKRRGEKYYSAYSPVFDSSNQVAAIVAVDFYADWYEAPIRQITLIFTAVGIMFTLFAAALIFLVMNRVKIRLDKVYEDLSALSSDAEHLSDEIPNDYGTRRDVRPEKTAVDDIGALSYRVHGLQTQIRRYLDFVREKAFTDGLTGIKNRTAFADVVRRINEKIDAGDAAFSLAVFDINGLKKLNDYFGHETGDVIITDAAEILTEFFGENCYRIGGDEFIAILQDVSLEEMKKKVAALTEKVEGLAPVTEDGAVLAFSKGCAAFDPEQDVFFNDVFKRADEEMYADKASFYNKRKGQNQ